MRYVLRFVVLGSLGLACLSSAAADRERGQPERIGEPADEPIFAWPAEEPLYIDRAGKVLLRPKCASSYGFSDGLALAVGDRRKYGYIDTRGRFAIAPRFDWGKRFSEGLAAVALDGKWGFIDKTGKVGIPAQFTEVRPFCEGLARVNVGGWVDQAFGPDPRNPPRYGFIDKTGKWVVGPTLSGANDYSDGLARVWSDAVDGYLDTSGRLVIDATAYDYAGEFSEGLAGVKGANGKCRYIDKSGKVVIEPECDWPDPFSDGLARVAVQRKGAETFFYGYIDKAGRLVIPAKFADGGRFRNGLAAVRVDSGPRDAQAQRWGYIDRTGKMVIPPKLNEAREFQNGLAWVHRGGKLEEGDVHEGPHWTGGEWRLIDAKGTTIWSNAAK